MPKRIDITGQMFGQLTVLGFAGKDKNGGSMWRCRCSCGNDLVVYGGNLKNGNTTSCGCKTREIVCKRCGKVFSARGSRAMYCDNCKLIIKRELQHRRERREKINQHKFERGEYIDKTTDNKSEHYQAAALADNKPRGDNKFKGVCRTYYGKEIKYYGRIRVRKNGVVYGFNTEKFATQKEAHEAYIDLKAQLVGDTLDDYIRKRQERDKRKREYKAKEKYRKDDNHGDK